MRAITEKRENLASEVQHFGGEDILLKGTLKMYVRRCVDVSSKIKGTSDLQNVLVSRGISLALYVKPSSEN